jgi:predicted nucleotidyltransferase
MMCVFYVHRPEWYLRVEAPRDVIELPIDDELDVSGWEWRKALGLLKGQTRR